MKSVIVHFNNTVIEFTRVEHCILKADIGLLEIFTADRHILICVDKCKYYEEVQK